MSQRAGRELAPRGKSPTVAVIRAVGIAGLLSLLLWPAVMFGRRLVGMPIESSVPWVVWSVAWVILIGPGVVMISRPATRFSGWRYLVTAALCGGIVAVLAAQFEYGGGTIVTGGFAGSAEGGAKS